MKNFFIYILIIISLSNCDKECFDDYGTWVEHEFEIETFSKITFYSGIELHIIDGAEQKVIAKTGEKRLDNIILIINDGLLEISSKNECLFNENYEPIQIFITHPNINSIRNAGTNTIFSDNTLTYPQLTLLSEDFQNPTYSNSGDFQLNIDNSRLDVISNGVSNFYISGNTQTLFLGYYSGLGKFEGQNLNAQHIEVFHRGENTLKIYPFQSLIGNIYSVGNIISYNHPEIVDVTQHYTGRLIYY